MCGLCSAASLFFSSVVFFTLTLIFELGATGSFYW